MYRPTPSLHVTLFLAAAVVLAGGRTVAAQNFSLQVGPPSAASPQPGSRERKVLSGVLAVRPIGCPDAASVTMSATAEGIDAGMRKTLPVALSVTSTPGVRLALRSWTDGIWIVRLVGHCAGRTAGALVTLAPGGAFRRDGVEYVAGEPTREQVDRSLQELTTGLSAVAAR